MIFCTNGINVRKLDSIAIYRALNSIRTCKLESLNLSQPRKTYTQVHKIKKSKKNKIR